MKLVLICLAFSLSLPCLASAAPLAVEAKAARQKVIDSLRDPDSARFRNVRVYKTEKGFYMFCGEVNSRNSFGGYVGYERFLAFSNMAMIAEDTRDVVGGGYAKAWAANCDGSVGKFLGEVKF